MFDPRSSLTSRRNFFQRGALVGGAAAVAAAGMPATRALAIDSVSDSRLKTVQDRGKLIVGTGATNPPWHFEDDNGTLVGMDIDMAKALAVGVFGIEEDPLGDDDAHVRSLIEFVIQEPNQRIPNLLTDKVDVVIQFMTITVNRATQVEFTIPYYREAVTLLLPGDSTVGTTLAEINALPSIKIAVLQNVSVEEATLRIFPNASIDQYPSIADAIAAMDAGRADGAAVDLSSGKWFASTTPGKYQFTEGWNPNSYAASVKPGDQIWLNLVNSAWHESMTGINFRRYAASFKQWFGEDLTPPSVGFPLEYK